MHPGSSRDAQGSRLKAHGDWMDLGGADEQKAARAGTVEAWGRSPNHPIEGWYGLKKGLRRRFGVYVPPLMEALGLVAPHYLQLSDAAKERRAGPCCTARLWSAARESAALDRTRNAHDTLGRFRAACPALPCTRACSSGPGRAAGQRRSCAPFPGVEYGSCAPPRRGRNLGA